MKKIGIVGWKIGENSYGVTIPYLGFFSNYGVVSILTPEQDVQDIDLLVLPGGMDVDPSRYGGRPNYYTGNPNVFLEHFDRNVLPKYIEQNIPIFGICRGCQTLAVAFGGTLKDVNHEFSTKSRGELVHKVQVELLNRHFIQEVNSLHHQAVDSISDQIKVIARHSKTDEIEAIGGVNNEFFGVQWHPEEVYDDISDKLIKILL